jgi:hypothetical protein
MRKLREQRASRSCRQIRKVDHDKMQDLACRLDEALKGPPPRIPSASITGHLHKILLTLGYEASLVEMLGQRYGG